MFSIFCFPVTILGGGKGFVINQDLYRETSFMGYYQGDREADQSGGNFWGNKKWRTFSLDSTDSEIHIVLLWAFAGADGGFNSRYATGEGSNVEYDIDGMKNEIDEMRLKGFVVSAGFIPYGNPSPPNEGPARLAILDHIANGSRPELIIGGGPNGS